MKEIFCKCGVKRHQKSSPGLCIDCRVKENRKSLLIRNTKILASVNLSSTDLSENTTGRDTITVINHKCNHTFKIKLNNILRAIRAKNNLCSVCGKSERAKKGLDGYLAKYKRTYNLKRYNEYASKVRYLSKKNWIAKHGSLETNRKIHLDHKVPIIYGFRNNLAPEILADIDNLQLLEASKNCSKGSDLLHPEILQTLQSKYMLL